MDRDSSAALPVEREASPAYATCMGRGWPLMGFVVVLGVAGWNCRDGAPSRAGDRQVVVTPTGPAAAEPYVPGLGEIMTLTQMRHAKLWFAAEAGNWELAAYEIDELREGLADAVRYHPQHKQIPESLAVLVPGYMDGPLNALSAAVNAHDVAGFEGAYDEFTAGCNGCHQATEFGFNVVRRPSTPPVSNQDFAPAYR